MSIYLVLICILTTISAAQTTALSPGKAAAIDILQALTTAPASDTPAAPQQEGYKGRVHKRPKLANRGQTPADAPQPASEEIEVAVALDSPTKDVPRRARSGPAPSTHEAESGQPFLGEVAAGMLEYSSKFPPGTGRGQVGHSFAQQSTAAPSEATDSIHHGLIQLEVGSDPALSSLKAAAVQALRECRGPFDYYRPKTQAQMKLDIAIRGVRFEAEKRMKLWDEGHSTMSAQEEKQLETVRKIYSFPAVCSANTPYCRS